MDRDDLVSPSNVLDLVVLGVESERARTAAEVISVVKRVGGARFPPTTDVITGRIAALAEAGLVVPASDGAYRMPDAIRWRPSTSGRAHVERLLMAQSAPPADKLAALCACLKICFLEMLDLEARDAVMIDLMAAYRRALSQAQAALTGCPCHGALVQRWLAREVERWQAELIWLEMLSGEIAAARSWRRGRLEAGL